MCHAEEEGQQNLFKGHCNDDKQMDENALKLKAAFDSHLSAIIINSFGAITMANKVRLAFDQIRNSAGVTVYLPLTCSEQFLPHASLTLCRLPLPCLAASPRT